MTQYDEAQRLSERLYLYEGEVYYRKAGIYEKQEKKEEAVKLLKEASKYAGDDILLRLRIKGAFERLGEEELAKAEEDEIEELSQRR